MATTNPYYFDEFDTRYRCCNCCHARTGAILMGIVELLCASACLGALVYAVVELKNVDHDRLYLLALIGGATASSITIVVVCLLLAGVSRLISSLIVPHLIWQALGIVALTVSATLSTVVLIALNQSLFEFFKGSLLLSAESKVVSTSMPVTRQGSSELSEIMKVVVPVLLFGTFAFEFWFFAVCLRAYVYAQDRQRFEKAMIAQS